MQVTEDAAAAVQQPLGGNVGAHGRGRHEPLLRTNARV